MKLYNPFKLHIVYNEKTDKYAARKLGYTGWRYLDVSTVYKSSSTSEHYFWSMEYNIKSYCYRSYDRVMEIVKEYKQPKPTNKDKVYKTL
jgi:hypothetical protein